MEELSRNHNFSFTIHPHGQNPGAQEYTQVMQNEGFGEENVLEFAPTWKGNSEISCLVSEQSRFLTKEDQEKHHRKEIAILGVDGKFLRVLSKDWPEKKVEPTMEKGPSGVPIEQLLK